MPVSGARRLRSTSTASALSGETYSTRQRCLAGGMASRVSLSNAHRKAASVLPDPVGAMTNALSPAEIACQAPCCACVGAAKTSSNHVRVARVKLSSGSSGTELSCPAAPTEDGGGTPSQSSARPLPWAEKHSWNPGDPRYGVPRDCDANRAHRSVAHEPGLEPRTDQMAARHAGARCDLGLELLVHQGRCIGAASALRRPGTRGQRCAGAVVDLACLRADGCRGKPAPGGTMR